VGWHPRSRYVEVEGRTAHCVDAGAGPPVLLLHGFLHSSWTWREAVHDLAPRYRVLAPDLRGFGWGDRGPGDYSLAGLGRWVEGVLDALGVGRLAGAVGNSLGGAILLDLALRDPGRVERLVLSSPLAAPLRVPTAPFRLLGLRVFGPLYQLTAGNPAFVRRALGLAAYRRRPVDDEVLRGFATLGRAGSHGATCAVAGALGAGSADLAARLEARGGGALPPTLVVWGERDGVLPWRLYGRAVRARLPDARWELFEGCGHCPHEEEPERFAALVRGWLAPAGPLRKCAGADATAAPAPSAGRPSSGRNAGRPAPIPGAGARP